MAPKPIVLTETVTVELIREVLIPVDDKLTNRVDIPQLGNNPDTLQLGATYRQTVTRLMVCNRRLSEIEGLMEK